jgi:hypothetical protein
MSYIIMAEIDSRKITVASLCHANEGTITTSTEATEQRHLYDYSTPSPPDVIPICAQGHHFERLDTTTTLPSLLPARLSSLDGYELVTQLQCVGRLDIADDSNGISNVIDTTDGALPHVNETIEHLSKVHTSTVQHCNGSGKTIVSNLLASSTMPGSTNAIHTYHEAGLRVQSMAQPTPTQSPQRVPRAARPPYTEEQKFFIVYQRIIGELS